MNNQLRQDRRKIILFIGIILICIAIAAALKIPRWKITREVRTYAEELPVRMEYAVPEQLSTRDEKLTDGKKRPGQQSIPHLIRMKLSWMKRRLRRNPGFWTVGMFSMNMPGRNSGRV